MAEHPVPSADRRRIRGQAVSISLAIIPFGVAFGVSVARAGYGLPEALGFSSLVFTGGTQFAAVGVLADGGTATAALIAGLLLSLRSLAYGVVMAPALGDKPRLWRALASHWMIDETMAVGSSQRGHPAQRYGYLVTGAILFACWNAATVAGVYLSDAGEFVERWGIDATIPAAFAALVWPRLLDPVQRWIVVGGAVIALALVPIAPAGLPIIAAGVAVALRRPTPPNSRTTVGRR
ncbi:MAG: AzlC family ABC transporter permease [Ilumatobacteraceae bacterium]